MEEEKIKEMQNVEKNINSGDKTINQVRTENGLSPLNEKISDQKLIKKG